MDIENFEEENITKFRSNCKNAKLRNIYFRLIHNDFFTHVRMKKYKMTEDDKCPRCGIVETSKHLIWECNHVKNIWKIFNNVMIQMVSSYKGVGSYDEVFQTYEKPAITIIKLRVIQELIQIERPKNWNVEKILTIINEVRNMELYNAKRTYTLTKFNIKWSAIERL